MKKELIVHEDSIIQSYEDVHKIGEMMARSGYFSDAKDAAKAVVKILAGREMGYGPFAAMNGIHIIQGKPTVGANLMAAAVKSHPRYDYRVTAMGDDKVSVAFYQNGDELGTSTFSVEDASDAGLMGRDNWKKYTRNMLFARAISNGVRWYTPDVFAGSAVYTPDELDDDAPPPEWDVVEGEVEEQEPEARPEPESIDTHDDALPADKPRDRNRLYKTEQPEVEKPTRPFEPEHLRDIIRKGIEDKREKDFAFEDGKLSNYRGAMNNSLELCFVGDKHSDQKRHFVLEYLTGKASSKDLDAAEVKTLHKWLNAKPDDDTGEWQPDQTAVIEARHAAKQAEKDAGQRELEL